MRKLAKPLGIPIGQLLVIAGYISEEEYETPIQQTDLARLYYEIGDLTDEEWKQVLEFGRYVRVAAQEVARPLHLRALRTIRTRSALAPTAPERLCGSPTQG